ncbi:hypothetical protein V5S96_08170 [Corynebacterium mastitidis]|uniref:Uncharacterized protein n=1 Tax=Corynebacterium mastitidis TaxID=161890 RepID=A0ABU8NZ91_9CORY
MRHWEAAAIAVGIASVMSAACATSGWLAPLGIALASFALVARVLRADDRPGLSPAAPLALICASALGLALLSLFPTGPLGTLGGLLGAAAFCALGVGIHVVTQEK